MSCSIEEFQERAFLWVLQMRDMILKLDEDVNREQGH